MMPTVLRRLLFLVPLILWPLMLASVASASAMTMHVVRDQAILTGPIVPDDVERFAQLLQANPAVTTVVLWDSPGGAFVGNRGLSAAIQEHGLRTAVAGHCVSACAMVFLSGRERFFSDGEVLDQTSLGFHGSYLDGGALTPDAHLQYLKDTVERETGGLADPALVDHWLHLMPRTKTVRFRYPGSDGTPRSPTVFDCEGPGPNRGDYAGCTPIAGPNALSMGVITSTRILHVER